MKMKFKPNNEYLTAFLFLAVLLVFFIGTGFKVGKNLADRLLGRMSNQSTQVDDKMNTQQINGLNDPPVDPSNNVTKIFAWIDRGIALIETMYDESAIFRKELIYINGGFQLLLNQRIVEDVDQVHTVYKLDNGQLTFQSAGTDMTGNIQNMKELYDYISSMNMKMLYIQAPFKVNKYDNEMPGDLEDTTNRNADDLMEGFRNDGVPYMDLRDAINDSGIVYDDLFYYTDHHWKMETAFWAYGYVMDYLTETYGMKYDMATTDLHSFRKIVSHQSFLGSQGLRVGRLYGGVDDFNYYIPDFHTSYSVQIYNIDGTLRSQGTGDFQDAIIMKDIVDMNSGIETSRYQAYFGGDHPLVKIVNLEQQNGKILIIKDSFARPFTAFMSLNFKETDVIDVRYYRTMTLFDHLKSNQYDWILFMYNPSEINGDELFTFR